MVWVRWRIGDELMPLGALKVVLLGASGSGGKSYWALGLHPNSDGDESKFFGIDVDSSDNVYLALFDNNGEETYLVKFEQSGAVPTVDAQTKLNNQVSPNNLTLWNDGGTETLTCSGNRSTISEACYIYAIGTDLTTAINSGRSNGILISSGDVAGVGSNQTELDTSNGKLFWSSIDAFNYFGWRQVQAGIWFENGYPIAQTSYPTYTGGSGMSSNNTNIAGNSAFIFGADRWGVSLRYSNNPVLAGNKNTSGNTVVGSSYEIVGYRAGVTSPSTSASWNPGETSDDYAYWVVTSQAGTVDLIKVNDSGTIQWNRMLNGNSMNYPGTTGTAGSTFTVCKPIFDSSNNVYIAFGDRVGGGFDRCSIVKYNSSGVLQFQNSIVTAGTGGNQLNPQQMRLSDDGEDLYVSINRTGSSFNGGTGIILKVPSDGTMVSSSSISLDGGTFVYNTSTFTDAAGTFIINAGTTAGWATDTSQAAASGFYPGVGATFTTHLHTAEIS